MMVRVKICGITSLRDALAAVEAGADALGFMFYEESPRAVSVRQAREIIRRLPPFVSKVGVFVNATAAQVKRIARECELDTLQFHGQETPDYCARFSLPVIKAFRIRDAASVRELPAYPVAAWLLDSFVPGRLGGTGAKFNWDLAVLARQAGRPVILAGGLTPANVAKAVRRVRPYAVDVSSGVETAPGVKDADKMRAFIRKAKGWR